MTVRPAYREGREALLDATISVVGREGLRGLTYRAVGAESGTTHALVSYHFGSRENLLRAAAEHAVRRAVSSARLASPAASDDGFGSALPEATAAHADAHAFLFELALEGRRDPLLRELVREQYAGFRALTATALGLEDPEDPLARLAFAAVDGLTLQQLIDGEAGATAEAVQHLQRLLGT